MRMQESTTVLFSTGRTPGKPMQTGQQLVFGSAPNSFLQAQNIFVLVFSSAWISRPTTSSYSLMRAPSPDGRRHADFSYPYAARRHTRR